MRFQAIKLQKVDWKKKSLSVLRSARGGSVNLFEYELAYFHTKIKDMIAIPSLASGLGEDTRNIGEATIDGVEFLISKNLNEAGTFGIPVSVTATFTNGEFDTTTGQDSEDRYSGGLPGNQIPYISDFQYNIRAGLEFEKWHTYLNYHWQDDVFTDATNQNKINDYGVFELVCFLHHFRWSRAICQGYQCSK